MHVAVERAQPESPYGGPIAHGFLTLSLAPKFLWEIYQLEGVKMGVNYGVDRVRCPAPVLAGKHIRTRLGWQELPEMEGGAQAVRQRTFEREGHEKPVCGSVLRWYVSSSETVLLDGKDVTEHLTIEGIE
jgi:acyl dehydratase